MSAAAHLRALEYGAYFYSHLIIDKVRYFAVVLCDDLVSCVIVHLVCFLYSTHLSLYLSCTFKHANLYPLFFYEAISVSLEMIHSQN